MRKTWKKLMTFALAGTMAIGMSTTALAANSNLNTATTDISDTAKINLLKDYVNGSASQKDTKSPAENFVFTIERYGLWNVGQDGSGKAKYTKDTMPTFTNGNTGKSNNTFTIAATEGAAGTTAADKLSTSVTVPNYDAVGDYWYKVTETDNNVAGVIYGTNDVKEDDKNASNNNHGAVYYLHVQVTNAETKGQYIRTVTMHKTAPALQTAGSDTTNTQYESWYAQNNKNSENQTDKKVNDIQNKYYAGSLNITKKVTGNAGDKNQLFEVTVTFTNTSGGTMNSNITYKNFYDEEGKITSAPTPIKWEGAAADTTQDVKFYVKDSTTVTFDNIPYGISYTVKETQPDDDKYTHSFAYTASQETAAGKFNGLTTAADTVTAEDSDKTGAEKWNAAQASGSISDDSDTVTITNTKTSTIDVGVITSNAPYIAMLLVAGVAVVMFIRRRREMIEE